MKKVTQFLSAVTFVATIGASNIASAWPAQFVGVWKNVNPTSRGIVRLEISPTMQVRAFGSCTPTPCDHGLTPLATFGNSVSDTNHRKGTAFYNFQFKNVMMSMKLQGAWHIDMEHWNRFTDGSGRQNYWNGERFKKVSAVESIDDVNETEIMPEN